MERGAVFETGTSGRVWNWNKRPCLELRRKRRNKRKLEQKLEQTPEYAFERKLKRKLKTGIKGRIGKPYNMVRREGFEPPTY